jgi:hypothetical protein
MLIAFAIVMRLDRWLEGTLLWYPAALFLGVPFYVLDVLYNWIIGSIIWREFPRELTYTDRLKRKKAEGEEEAFEQCRILSKFDPNHC